MNCDEFLDALTSPDEGRQTAARWHANSCPACAALAEVDARLKKELSESESLPQRMRAVWVAATADDSTRNRNIIDRVQVRLASEGRNFARQLRPLHILAIAAALLFFIAGPLLFWHLNEDVVKQPEENIPTAPVIAVARTIDASAELDKLLAQVTTLEAELNKTSTQADLVDVRREADLLLATYNHW